jgi:hypothetical protein
VIVPVVYNKGEEKDDRQIQKCHKFRNFLFSSTEKNFRIVRPRRGALTLEAVFKDAFEIVWTTFQCEGRRWT